MARPKKEKLEYFSLDVDIFSNVRIKALMGNYGNDGFTAYIRVLCDIYRSKGYYLEYSDDYISIFSKDLGFTKEKTMQIINYLCSRSLLTQRILTGSDKVVTAKSVQERYQNIMKSLKRDVFVDNRIWLLNSQETESCIKVQSSNSKSEKNPNKSEKNPNKSEKNPTKESKEKYNIRKYDNGKPTYDIEKYEKTNAIFEEGY